MKLSVEKGLATAPDIEHLAFAREALAIAHAAGTLNPDKKTVAHWHKATWDRVIRLLLDAPDGGTLSRTYDRVRLWDGCPPEVHDLFKELAYALPSEAERLLARGVTIVGVTDKSPRPPVCYRCGEAATYKLTTFVACVTCAQSQSELPIVGLLRVLAGHA